MGGYTRAMRNYAGFAGRSSRAEFWEFTLVPTVMLLVIYYLVGSPKGQSIFVNLPALLVVLVHVVPGVALTVRRLHDAGYSGWWALLSAIPLGNFILLAFACVPGTGGPNRYGPDPLGSEGTAPIAAVSTGAGVPIRPAATAPPRDVIAELERLAQLKANGTLSEAEFAVMKAQALREGQPR